MLILLLLLLRCDDGSGDGHTEVDLGVHVLSWRAVWYVCARTVVGVLPGTARCGAEDEPCAGVPGAGLLHTKGGLRMQGDDGLLERVVARQVVHRRLDATQRARDEAVGAGALARAHRRMHSAQNECPQAGSMRASRYALSHTGQQSRSRTRTSVSAARASASSAVFLVVVMVVVVVMPAADVVASAI